MSLYGAYDINCNAVSVNGTPELDFKYVNVVLGPVMELFVLSPHILYVDACYTFDKVWIALCVFRDMNAKVQTLGFSIFESESNFSWEGLFGSLKRGGLENISDLVFICDHGKSIAPSIRKTFENAEITLCTVHTERIITDTWEKEYGRVLLSDETAITTLNYIIACFNKARVAITANEWRQLMDEIKSLELAYREEQSIVVEEIQDDSKGIYQYG